MDRAAWRATVHLITKSWTQLSNTHTHTHIHTHKSHVTLAIHILTLTLRGLNHQRFLFHSSYMPVSGQLVALFHTYPIQWPRLTTYLPSLWQESEESPSKK